VIILVILIIVIVVSATRHMILEIVRPLTQDTLLDKVVFRAMHVDRREKVIANRGLIEDGLVQTTRHIILAF